MANATSTELQELYVAYFARAADPAGLDYWVESGISQADFAAQMHAAAEFQEAFGDLNTQSQVNQIYQNLFDREADVDGLAYWTLEVDLGNIQLAEIATHLIWAAQNNEGGEADDAALSNRTAAAEAYTAEVGATSAGRLAYAAESEDPWVSGDNIQEAKDFMADIDGDTAHTAEGVTASVNTILGTGEVATTGLDFSLTDEADEFTGGDADDTFTGGQDTMAGADELDGGAGNDTLTIRMDANDVLGIIRNIETIEIIARGDGDGTFLDVEGVTSVILNDSSDDFDLDEFDHSVALTLKDSEDDYTVAFADLEDDADSQSVTVDGFEGNFIIATEGLETLAITASGEESEFTVEDNNATAAIETITIDGSVDVDLTIDAETSELETINAGDATGDVTITSDEVALELAITTGTGADTIELGDTLASSDDIDGGDGADTLEGEIDGTGTVRVDADNVETLDVDFTAAGTLDLRDTDSVATLDLGGSTAAMDVNRASVLLTDVVFDDSSDADFDIDYASGVDDSALTVTIGDEGDDDTDGIAVDTGDFTTDAVTLTIASIGEEANTIDTITANDATTLNFTTSTEDGTLNAGNVEATELTTLSLAASEGDLTVGTYVLAENLTSLTLSATGEANLTLGNVGTTDNSEMYGVEDLTVTVEEGNLDLGTFFLSSSDEEVELSEISITSAGEDVELQGGGDFIDGDSNDNDVDLDALTFTLTGDDVDADVGDIDVNDIDEITIEVSGEDGDFEIDELDGDDMGNVEITAGEDTRIDVTLWSADEIGDISLTAADGATIILEQMDVNGDVGTIDLSGDGTFDIDITDATTVGEIDASTDTTDESTVNISLEGSEAGVTVNFGEGDNDILLSNNGDDEINLTEDEGDDSIVMNGTQTGDITIDNFDLGTDVIDIDESGILALSLDGGTANVLIDVDLTHAAAGAGNVILLETDGVLDFDDTDADANIVVLDADVDDLAALETALADNGTHEITTVVYGADEAFLVLWDDGDNSYLTVVANITANSVDNTILSEATIGLQTIVTFTDIDDCTDIDATDLGTAIL